MSPDKLLWQTEGEAELSDFIFEEVPQRFDQFKLQVFGQATHIMVQFDRRRGPVSSSPTFDDVGIECALSKKVRTFNLGGLIRKTVDEGAADTAAFFLRVSHAGKHVKKPILSWYDMQVCLEVVSEFLNDGSRLVFPEQAIVDQDAGELIANCPADESGHNGRINAAREAANHPALPHSLAD